MPGKMLETTVILVIALTVFSTAVLAGAHFMPSFAEGRATTPDTSDKRVAETTAVDDARSGMQDGNEDATTGKAKDKDHTDDTRGAADEVANGTSGETAGAPSAIASDSGTTATVPAQGEAASYSDDYEDAPYEVDDDDYEDDDYEDDDYEVDDDYDD